MMLSSTLSTKPAKSQRRLALEEMALRQARGHFTKYKQLIWHRYQRAPHLDLLDWHLMEVEKFVRTRGIEGISRLMVFEPPRHGKSLTISRFFPTWFLGRNPDKRVILASYGATLSEKHSRYARNVIMTPRYRSIFRGVELSKDSAAKDAWDLAGYDGGLEAVGVRGGITGKGGDLVIVDDPVKSRDEAESPTVRDATWDWYTDDLYTRQEPHTAYVIVMTRWQEDDLAGRELKLRRDKWTVLNLPALAEENDPLGRAVGAALWPERFPLATLEDIRSTLGEYAWSALYQQRPVPAEGGLFKRAGFTLIDFIPDCSQVVRYWDLAMSEKTSADYTVGVKLGMEAQTGRIVVLDVVRRQVEWPDVAEIMAQAALEDGPEVLIGYERKGFMTRAGQDLATNPRLHMYSIWGEDKDVDKVTHALPFISRVGEHVVDVVQAHWNGEYLDELCSFPRGAHDDQVDASSGAYKMLSGGLFSGGAMNYADDFSIDSSY